MATKTDVFQVGLSATPSNNFLLDTSAADGNLYIKNGNFGGSPTDAFKLSSAGNLTVYGTLNYGGVTISATPTGTGNVVLSASPTLTGTLTAAAITASGNVTISTGSTTSVPYLNGSKVLTTSANFQYNGTKDYLVLGGGGYTTALTEAVGQLYFNGGVNDSPGVHFCYGNNINYGIDGYVGSLRFVKDMGESTGAVMGVFDSNSCFRIGSQDATYTTGLFIQYAASIGVADIICGGTGGRGIGFFANAVDANGYNTGAACAFGSGKNNGTGRSGNFGGTLNASGADYAEYEVKDAVTDIFDKGAIIGFDSRGKLCPASSLRALSFGVKSTSPSLVGGDTWGVGLTGDPAEAARQWVDRIAYSGKVPVNVTNAMPGNIIVSDNGGEAWDLANDPEVPEWFKKYLRSVGRVRRILEDGRAEIAVYVN